MRTFHVGMSAILSGMDLVYGTENIGAFHVSPHKAPVPRLRLKVASVPHPNTFLSSLCTGYKVCLGQGKLTKGLLLNFLRGSQTQNGILSTT